VEGEIPTFVFLKRGPNKDVAEYLGKFFFLKIEDANAIIGALDVNKMTNLIEKISGGKVGSIDIYDLGINEKAAEAIFDIARSLGSQAILIVTEPELITEVPPPEEIETEIEEKLEIEEIEEEKEETMEEEAEEEIGVERMEEVREEEVAEEEKTKKPPKDSSLPPYLAEEVSKEKKEGVPLDEEIEALEIPEPKKKTKRAKKGRKKVKKPPKDSSLPPYLR